MAEEKKLDSQPKSKWGGKRQGAGMKPSPVVLTTINDRRRFFHKLLTEKGDFEGICLSLFRAAKKNPKVAAYVVDQAIGKALQGIELTGKDGAPIDFRNLSDDELRQRITGASGAGEAGTGSSPLA